MGNPGDWTWLCGSDTLENFTWTGENIVENLCVLDGLSSVFQAAFLFLFSSSLLLLKCCLPYRHISTTYLVRYPGHFVRWLMSMLLIVAWLASIGEGALTSMNFIDNGLPHLYIAPAFSIVCFIMTLVVNQHMEVWRQPKLSWLLLLYWLGSVVIETGQLLYLIENEKVDADVVRFDVVVFRLATLCVLCITEINVIRIKIFHYCDNRQSDVFPRDLKSSTMHYYQEYSNSFSAGIFHWLQPVLRTGANRPLQIVDLGTVPYKHGARGSYEEFIKAFSVEKEQCLNRGKNPNIWKVCGKVSGFWLVISILIRFVSDSLAFVSPLVISGITFYADRNNTESMTESGNSTFVEVHEYFANGYILLILAVVSFAAKGLIQANSIYIQQIQGIKLKVALQGLVYEKSLRISTFLTSSGTMTMGQISNHMGIDTTQAFWMSVIAHMIFTAPVNVIVTLVLLYYQLGSASLIGASVILVIFPFQMKVARTLVHFQKKMLSFSDQRLKKSNELLQGMKLLKLYGWEEMYEMAIEAVRNKELKCLSKLLICNGITIAFTIMAPTIMTLTAFTLYPTLSGKSLQPGVTFASLTLFSQLSLPLFSVPMAISTLVNCMVSFRRLGAFFMAKEVYENEETRNWQDADIDEEESDGEKSAHDVATRNGNGYSLLFNDEKEQKPNRKTNLLSTASNGTAYGATETAQEANSKTSLLSSRPTTPNVIIYGSTGALTSSLREHGVPLNRSLSPLPEAVAIEIEDGSFTWDQDSVEPILSNINVQIPAGKLTMIVGQVGMGKSSLLSAINGEMVTLSGRVQFNSEKNRVAYAAQKAWLCNTSLRDNILFGQEMDEPRYKEVISACALGPDIDILPAGDMTEIGEKGINLSGGQKQRVSVARAMYANRDIVILDDPLSALDVHVGSHLFQEGIVTMLLKQHQTVVLVTHQLQYLEYADKILVLKDGCIKAEGTVDVVTEADPDLYYSWRHALHKGTESESTTDVTSDQGSQSEAERDDLRKQVRKRMVERQVSEEKAETSAAKGKLIEEEEMERGSVSYKVYFFYLQSVGFWTVFVIILFCLSQMGLQTINGFWLAFWSETGLESGSGKSASYYIKGFIGLQSATIASQFLGILLIAYAAYTASVNVHFAMLRNIVRAPIRFFDTTPVGRILNRMSTDQQLIDMRISTIVFVLLNGLFLCVSAVIVNSIITPWFIGLALPMCIFYFYVQSFYLKSTRELQRIDSITRSPVFAFFSETLTGLETIRAYKDQKRFFRTFIKRLDLNIIPFLYLRVVMGWLGIRLDLMGAVIVLLAGGSALVGSSLGMVSPGFVGLGLSLSISVAGFLNYLVRSASDLEIMMNAVERVKHYTSIENEDYEGMMPPRTWPQNGEICIERLSARYAKHLDPVLKKISVNIKAGEKVGICGRTGSGKSSLTLSLFRIIDTFEGRIIIDGVDISSVPLTTLRQKLSIIPQDPVLFTGSIRQNLDPEGHRSDDALWEAVEIAQLRDVVQTLPEGLEYMVTEGGENFSMGQRQLFCLARAFLRKSRILIMDEATASIDMQTDKILQKVVATAFVDRTVLTIAHRVTTILNCDTILVLSDGEIVEHDSPENLMAQENSIFADFVKSKK